MSCSFFTRLVAHRPRQQHRPPQQQQQQQQQRPPRQPIVTSSLLLSLAPPSLHSLGLRRPASRSSSASTLAPANTNTIANTHTPSEPLQTTTTTPAIQQTSPQPNMEPSSQPGPDPEQDTEPPPRKKVKLDSPKPIVPTCCICCSEIDGPYSTPCRQCWRPQCYSCVRTQLMTAVHDHEQMPARCCRRIIHHDVGRGILDPAELEIYKQRYDESSTPNPFYCPVPTCSTFIPPRMLKPTHGKITCHICNTVSCVKCKTPATQSHVCSGDDDRVAILKTFSYKLCPKCGTGIMRMFGCPHVRCQCGAHWCWDCQRPMQACYKKPCSTARGDGEPPRGDDSESADDYDDASPYPATSIELLPSDSTEAPPAIIPEIIAAGPSPLVQLDPLTDALTVQTAQTQAGMTNVEAVRDEAPQQVTNLDDPEEADWEGMSLDFGEEPIDEPWDLWGCQHRFQDFMIAKVPDRWLVGIAPSEGMEVECMQCFRPAQVQAKRKANEESVTKSAREELTAPATSTETQTTNEGGAAGKKLKKSPNKEGAFECQECGVICCWWCRRSALRQVSRHRSLVE